MDITKYSDEYIARNITGCVLRGLQKKDLLRESYGFYRILLPVDFLGNFFTDMDAVWFFAKQDDVHESYKNPMYTTGMDYEIVLSEKEYTLHYLTKNGYEGTYPLHRDLLCNLYEAGYPDRICFDRLLAVDRSSMSGYRVGYPYREISLYSSMISSKAFVSFYVNESDIVWVPVRSQSSVTEYLESDVLEPFVDVRLSQISYMVRYKNESTQWKDHTISVSKQLLFQDHILAMRAAAANVSIDLYNQWLVQEYDTLLQLGVGMAPNDESGVWE